MVAEIPGFASASSPLPAAEKTFTVRVPYPEATAFEIRTYVDYHGLTMEPTVRRLDYRLPDGRPPRRPPDWEILEGEGPREKMTGRELVSVDRVFRFRVNRPAAELAAVRIELFLPFVFEDFWWHGDFVQEAEILVKRTAARVPPGGPGGLHRGQSPLPGAGTSSSWVQYGGRLDRGSLADGGPAGQD
jgi:hypothetical protein